MIKNYRFSLGRGAKWGCASFFEYLAKRGGCRETQAQKEHCTGEVRGLFKTAR
jgi:hypothetical protein